MCRQSQGLLRDRLDFVAEKFAKCYSTDDGVWRQEDVNLDCEIKNCIQYRWPFGVAGLDETPREVLEEENRAVSEAAKAAETSGGAGVECA